MVFCPVACSPVGNTRKLDYVVGTGPHGLAVFVGNYHCSGVTGITWVCVVGTMFHPLNFAFPLRGTASRDIDGYMEPEPIGGAVEMGLEFTGMRATID